MEGNVDRQQGPTTGFHGSGEELGCVLTGK